MERRTLIRLLVGLGLGIPILIEAVTFLGLVETRLFGPGDRDDGSLRVVGIGDELLPGTPQRETVIEGVVRGEDRSWVFALTVEVENGTEDAYELELGTLTLADGATVESGAGTGRVAPGESGRVTGAWEIPPESTPDVLEVTATAYGDATPTTTTARVRLGEFPVRT